MNTTTTINTTAITAAAQAWVIAAKARKAAHAAFDAAQSLSKRSKSRDLLIAATQPAYDVAKAADEAAYRVLADAKAEATTALEVALLDDAVDAALQRASKRLDVDFHRVAGLVSVARGFRKSVEQNDWKAARSIVLDNASGNGVFDGIFVTVESNHEGRVTKFEVAFNYAYVSRDGKTLIDSFSPCRVDAEGFCLTSTNLDHAAIAPHAFSRAWTAAEVLADVAKALCSPEANAARKAIDAAVDAVLDAATQSDIDTAISNAERANA